MTKDETESLPAVEVVDETTESPAATTKKADAYEIMTLRKKGLSYQQIADITKTHKSSVYRMVKRLQDEFKELENIDEYEATKHDLLSAAERRLLKSVMDRDLSEEKVSSIVSAFDKLYKARRLQTGQSTENTSVHTFHSKDKADKE